MKYVVQSEEEEVVDNAVLGLDVGLKRNDEDDEDIEVNLETEEGVAEQVDPYQTWFNRRVFSDEQKAEADRILCARFSLFTLGIRIRCNRWMWTTKCRSKCQQTDWMMTRTTQRRALLRLFE